MRFVYFYVCFVQHFVSERKLYEDLSGTQRFTCDFSHMLAEVNKFGEGEHSFNLFLGG